MAGILQFGDDVEHFDADRPCLVQRIEEGDALLDQGDLRPFLLEALVGFDGDVDQTLRGPGAVGQNRQGLLLDVVAPGEHAVGEYQQDRTGDGHDAQRAARRPEMAALLP